MDNNQIRQENACIAMWQEVLGDGTSVSENPFAGGMSDDNLY